MTEQSAPISEIEKHSREVANALYQRFDDLLTNTISSADRQNIVLAKPREALEPHAATEERPNVPASYYRWWASAATNTLTVRAHNGCVELFWVPTSEVILLSDAEHDFRRVGKLVLEPVDNNESWMLDGKSATPKNIVSLLERILCDLLQPTNSAPLLSELLTLPGISTQKSSLQELITEKQNLIYKLVMQEEVLKAQLARDLHDTIIADLMMLKRYVLGDRKLTNDEIAAILGEIIQRLREICHECTPRNLQDWGLKTSLQALLDQIEQRSAMDCSLVCDDQLPSLPDLVQLNIYRIVQEALNNIEKYASASRIVVKIERSEHTLTVVVSDNGKGFSTDSLVTHLSESSGFGLGGMQERAALIRTYYPADFAVKSSPAEGTTISLKLTLPG